MSEANHSSTLGTVVRQAWARAEQQPNRWVEGTVSRTLPLCQMNERERLEACRRIIDEAGKAAREVGIDAYWPGAIESMLWDAFTLARSIGIEALDDGVGQYVAEAFGLEKEGAA